MMERILKCVKFEFKRMTRFIVISTAFYLLFCFIISAAMSFGGPKDYTSSNFMIVAIIYLIIFFNVYYSGMYNNLMLFGNTRKIILISLAISSALISAVLSILSMLNDSLNVLLAKVFHFHFVPLFSLLYEGKPQPNLIESFLWLFTIMLMFCGLAILYSVLRYKIGKKFVPIFWIGICLISTLSPLLTAYPIVEKIITSALLSFVGIGFNHLFLAASLHFFIAAVIFGLIIWLIARRQPQRA